MKEYNGNKPRAEWKPPPGYESAKAKAIKKWKSEQPKTRVNMFDGEDSDECEQSEELRKQRSKQFSGRRSINGREDCRREDRCLKNDDADGDSGEKILHDFLLEKSAQ